MNKVLVLGVTGMLGSTLARNLSKDARYEVFGTCRDRKKLDEVTQSLLADRLFEGVDARRFETVEAVIKKSRADTIINCVGIVKQSPVAKHPVPTITVNALFPHQVEDLSKNLGKRMIHLSTDCVFSGRKNGAYTEQDESDATDLYGKTKSLGEVYSGHCVTLRAPFIGHELHQGLGLIEWFLGQKGPIKGFTSAIYTGVPTVELSEIIGKFVIPDPGISGLYQISSSPISKFELLKLVAKQYGKNVVIEPSDQVRDNKALDSTPFRKRTGYVPPSWPELVEKMHKDFMRWKHAER